MLWALRRRDHGNFRNFQLIATWHVLIGVLWIGGALVEGRFFGEPRMRLLRVKVSDHIGAGADCAGLCRGQQRDGVKPRCGALVRFPIDRREPNVLTRRRKSLHYEAHPECRDSV